MNTAKKLLSVLVALALMATVISGTLSNIAKASTENLLKNSSFESFNEGAFTDWYLWPGNHGNTTAAQVAGKVGSAAKLSVNDNSSIVNISQVITPEAEGEYTLSVWIKIENIVRQWETAPGVYLTLRNDNVIVAQSTAVNTDTDWQKLELTVDAAELPAGEKTFDLTIEYVKGDIFLDEAFFGEKEEEPVPTPTPTPTPTPSDPDELLLNNSFEQFSAEEFANWYLWKGNHGNTTATQVAGKVGSAAKLSVNDNSSIVNISQVITFDTNEKYTLSVWIKIENIVRQWETAPGVYLTLRNDNTIVAQSTAVNTDTDWQKLELTVDAAELPAGAKTLDLTIEYVKGDIFLDEASFKKGVTQPGPTPPPAGEPDNKEDEEDTAPLKNSSFETMEGTNFKYWTFWPGNKGNTLLEQADGRTDKAAKFVIDNNENIVRLYQEVTLDPTKEYTFSVWVKTENVGLQWATAPGVYVNLTCNNVKVLASETINKDSDWTKLSVVINGAVLKGDEWSVCFDIAAEYMTGNVYIDDATLEVTGEATPIIPPDKDELLENNSFEIYSAGNFANWTTWKGNKGNTKFEQVKGRTGKGVKITIDDNNNIVNLYQELELDPTKEYTFSVWVKTENVKLQWAGAQGVYLNFKYNNNVILMSKPVAEDKGWTKLELKVNGGILKGDEWGVSLDIAAEYMTGTVYVDDASVKATGKGSAVPEEAEDELLSNSSLELFSGYNFAKWGLNKGNQGNTLLTQVKGKTGKAAKLVVDNNNNIVSLYQGVALDPTKEYTFSVWVKTENIDLQWAGAEGVYLALGYSNLTPVRSKAIKTDSDWTKLEVIVGGGDIPSDAWDMRFAVMAEFLTGTIYIDDASMKITGEYTPRPDSYLENGGFETPDEDTLISGWEAYAEDIYSVLDRNGEKTVNSSNSASVFNGDKNVVAYWEQRLGNLDRKKDYLLTGYIFSDMIVSDEGGAAVFVEFYDREGHLIRTYRTDYVKGEQEDWTEFSMKLSFPENCYTMSVKAALVRGIGTAYFDEFTLVDYNSDVHTAQLGTVENLYKTRVEGANDYELGTEQKEEKENTSSANLDKEGIPVYVWFIIGGAVLLIAAAVTAFVIIKKKKASK